MIISINEGGLSNRLKTIASCIRLDKDNYGIKWNILDDYNKKNHILNCPFNKLFKNNIEVKEIKKDDKVIKNPYLAIKESDNLPDNFNTFKSKCSRGFECEDPKNRNIDYMYNKIPKSIKYEFINCFKKLKPIDQLREKIDFFSKKFNNNTISVHIRSWNRNGEKSRRDGLFNIDKFVNEMKKYNKHNFFMSTDSEEVKKYFSEESELKDRIIFYSRTSSLNNSRDFIEGMQEDLIELYLLSKNKIIIGSHFSTFTEVAWYLACCPRTITIL